MRALLLVAVLACGCKRDSPAVKADPDGKKLVKTSGVVIHRGAPRVGDRARETRKQSMEMSMLIGGSPSSPMTITMSHDDVRTEEVLAVEGRVVTKLRVTYDSREETSSSGGSGPPVKKPSPVAGQTYVVAVTKSGVEVVDVHGKKLPVSEAVVVEKDYAAFGKEDEVLAGLPDTPLRVGDPAPSLARAFRDRVGGVKELEPEGEVVVKVDKVTNDEVVFSVRATFVAVRAGTLSMKLPITGTLTVRASDGATIAYEIEAPLTIGSGDAGIAMSGTGRMSVSAKRETF